jgi:2-hydroxychromene-2-carboxylate isomerase
MGTISAKLGMKSLYLPRNTYLAAPRLVRKVIEFWFDSSSPYAYFASETVERFAAETGRSFVWRPFLLGVIFPKTNMAPFVKMPIRGDEAVAKNVFGSPFFIADGEPFWGWDRMPMMRQWIENGGW